jgi:phage major head subunit gpT-like protein
MLTQDRINAASAGFRAVFLKAYEGATPEWQMAAMEVPSTNASETYEFITAIPAVKELLGEANLEQFASAGFTILNKEWEATAEVPIADIERDKIGLFAPTFQEMADSARWHPQELVADLLNGGFTTTLDYTGTAFFAANKKYNPADKSKGAPTFTNSGTAALTHDSLSAARASLRSRKNAKGKSLRLGRKFVLIVPPALETTALKLQNAELIQSADGAASETNTLRGTFETLVMPELTSDTAWFLIEAGRAIKPMIVQMEKRPEFIAADNMKDAAIVKTKKFLYQSYGRYNAAPAFPQLAYGSTGLT